MLAFIISLLALSLLLIFHEMGHFFFARRYGVNVSEFGFGFPPRLFGWRKNGVIYSVNAIPFGAFVKIDEGKKENPTPGSFAAQSLGHKNMILLGGVLANFIIAFLILSLLFTVGIPASFLPAGFASSVSSHLTIMEVEKNMPAASYLQKNDTVLSVSSGDNSYSSPDIEEFQSLTQSSQGEVINLVIERDQREKMIALRAQADPQTGKYMLGVNLVDKALVSYPALKAPGQAIRYMAVTLKGIGKIFKNIKSISGPVGVMVITMRGFEFGWRYWLFIIGIISYNLVLINLLPFPALDGGRMLFLSGERLIKKQIPSRVEELINSIGFILLIMLLIVITFKDINVFFLK